MSLQELKTNFHELIDTIKDQELLRQAYLLVSDVVEEQKDADWWNTLSPEHRQKITGALEAFEKGGSFTPHSQVQEEAKKWLKE